jgi:sugar phosphate isomerase/epimerase
VHGAGGKCPEIRHSLPSLHDGGVRLAIENHGDLTSTELVDLVERIDDPAVGICLDTGNALAVFEDPLAAAERMIPFAVTTHFKDCAVIPTGSGFRVCGAPLGRGMLPLEDLFRLIEEQGEVDRLILELPMEPGGTERESLEREDEAVRASVAFLRERLLPVST